MRRTGIILAALGALFLICMSMFVWIVGGTLRWDTDGVTTMILLSLFIAGPVLVVGMLLNFFGAFILKFQRLDAPHPFAHRLNKMKKVFYGCAFVSAIVGVGLPVWAEGLNSEPALFMGGAGVFATVGWINLARLCVVATRQADPT